MTFGRKKFEDIYMNILKGFNKDFSVDEKVRSKILIAGK
jgi:hypothetical protein